MAAIPRELIESELFGHERGAFTGATTRTQGRFEQANGGTLFLDEIGDMPPEAQTRLLRVLQEGEFTSVGGRQPIKANVRIIAATHRDLRNSIRLGQFREDLFYRLNVIPVELPALRERKDDIPLLAQHFVQKFAGDRAARTPVTIAQGAMRRLMAYPWPGNVRQLENAVEHAVAFSGSRNQIDVGDLPPDIQQTQELALASPVTLPEDGMDLEGFIARVERELIERSLERTAGNKGHAARLLGLKRTTLVEKIKRLGGV
jgi:two-component system nitrogen regulation response regulator GlnG